MKKLKINDDFFKVWSPDMAYILGFITADGCIHKKRLRIELSLKDIEVLEFIKSKFGNLNIRKYNRINKGDFCCIDFVSDEIVKDLYSLGVQERKTGSEFWANPPNKFIPDYIRGYFDGDGCVCNKEGKSLAVTISCDNKNFLEKIKDYFNFGYIDKELKSNCYRYSIYHSRDVKVFKDTIYNSNFSLKRKKSVFDNIKITKRMTHKHERDYLIEVYEKFGRIKCIEECIKLGINYNNVKTYRQIRRLSCQVS